MLGANPSSGIQSKIVRGGRGPLAAHLGGTCSVPSCSHLTKPETQSCPLRDKGLRLQAFASNLVSSQGFSADSGCLVSNKVNGDVIHPDIESFG